jgi:hypothetical protein
VLGFRQCGPALVWYRPAGSGWERYIIEKDFLPIEAGGALADIDGDGYPDLVFGGDWQSNCLWWWRNPGKDWKPYVPWERHTIKKDGRTQHHDQIFGDFKGTGRPQLVFWNQGADQLLIADIPPDPRHADRWPTGVVFSGQSRPRGGHYAEGLAAADIDGDGKLDIVAGNYWFKHLGGNTFRAVAFANFGGRVAVGRFKPGRCPQIVVNSGDGVGPLQYYECGGDPGNPKAWTGRTLVEKVTHGHSLQVADIDGDGHLDIFAAEMAKWSEGRKDPDNPGAKAWIFFGDGQGHFRQSEFATGLGFHEAQVTDLNGDGLMDILDKPYNWDVPRVDVWLQRRPGAAPPRRALAP